MQGQDRVGYFVRLGSTTGTTTPSRPRADDHSRGDDPRRPRPARFKLTFLHVVGIALIGGLIWAATTPGGVIARRDDILDALQGVVDDATTDPGLKRAARYYNDRYARDASYPNLSAEELREDPEAGWGIGVEIEWCSSNAIVLYSLTGRGTISRLLAGGDDLGDVPGKVQCPADLLNPLPWRYREP